jgi:YgiT-type zinc finger domain-containing protein
MSRVRPERGMYDYGECRTCNGRMAEKRVKQEFWIKGKLIVIEGIPAGVCPQCGEKNLTADVRQSIAAILRDLKRLRRAQTMTVPVIRFAGEVT